jgi:DNA polymerase-3 subunit epsilon
MKSHDPAQNELFALDGIADLRRPATRSARAHAKMPPDDGLIGIDADEAMAKRLAQTGRYRILRQLLPRPVSTDWPPAAEGRKIGIILDTETTGLDHAKDEIIELGMVAFLYDESGIGAVVDVYSALHQPSQPIPAEITRITGITDDMVAGQALDLDTIAAFAAPADLVIAHNARFDRPFCERFLPGFGAKPWACSVAEIGWAGFGFEGAKLGYLVAQSGWFHNGHRAVDDCHALLEVLAAKLPGREDTAFTHLLASSKRKRARIWAENSPFHAKDILKGRGYRWSDGSNGQLKSWWTEVDEDRHDAEIAFLRDEIYQGRADPFVQWLDATERFKR